MRGGGILRVAHVTSVLGREGAGVQAVVEALSAQQLEAGQNVRVFGLESPGWNGGDRDSWRGAPAEAFATYGPRAVGYAPALATALSDFSPDVIHLHGLWTWPSIAALRVSHRLGVARVVSPHGMLDPWALSQSRARKRLAMALFERTNLNGSTIHALCSAEAQALRVLGLVSPVAVIPNGVHAHLKDHPAQVVPPWAERIGGTSRVMLYLSRIHPKKGLPALIDALAATRHLVEAGDWHLVIAGWDQGNHRADLQAQIDAVNLANRIHFVGPVFGADKHAALTSACLFVLPSFSEGLPVAVLEAWAFGLPVLMTPQCNLPEGVVAGAAWEAHPQPAALAARLEEVLPLNREALVAAGRAGAQLVADKFTWPVVEAKFFEVYSWLVNNAGDPDGRPAFIERI